MRIGSSSRRRGHPTREEAEGIAIAALAFLADEPARLSRFLRLTGLVPADLAAGAGEPGLQAALLQHLLSDESLLLVFAADSGVDPELIEPACAILAGEG
jgi:hypothetical protein